MWLRSAAARITAGRRVGEVRCRAVAGTDFLGQKVIGGRPYWYLREMGWVDGKPKLVSERYVGTAAEIGRASCRERG